MEYSIIYFTKAGKLYPPFIHNPFIMKLLLLFFGLFLHAAHLKSQSSLISYFVVDPRYAMQDSLDLSINTEGISEALNGLPDSAQAAITILVAIDAPVGQDSLYITLSNSQSQCVYNVSDKINNWQARYPSRLQDGKLYLTLAIGEYPYVKAFKAKAHIKYENGGESPVEVAEKK